VSGKKNPLWDTDLQLFTRSVTFWHGSTAVRGSFPEALLELSATYDNGSMPFRGETRAVAARKSCLRSVYCDFFLFRLFFLEFSHFC
jgi:hypothetical protein